MTREDINNLVGQAGSRFHCAEEYRFHQVKDDLQEGVELLEKALEMAREEDLEDFVIHDLERVTEHARDVADAEAPIREAGYVNDLWEFGLGLIIMNGEDCIGYARGNRPEYEDLGLKGPIEDPL